MTNIQRTINWIDRSVEEAPQTGERFSIAVSGNIIQVFFSQRAQGFYQTLDSRIAPSFTHYTRDKITP